MYKKFVSRQEGFAFLIPLILIAVALTGTAVTLKVKQNADVKKAEQKAEQELPKSLSRSNNVDVRGNASVTTPGAPAAPPAAVNGSVAANNKPSPPPAPKPAPPPPPAPPAAPPTWNIVHPSASTCSQGTFTVYGSLSGGTSIYNYYNRGGIVVGTLAYKQSKAVRCENSGFGPDSDGEWLEYGTTGVDGGEKYININDVSTTAPPA
jgi:hypothetical protein